MNIHPSNLRKTSPLRIFKPAWTSASKRNAIFFGLMCSRVNIITTARYMERNLYLWLDTLFESQLVLVLLENKQKFSCWWHLQFFMMLVDMCQWGQNICNKCIMRIQLIRLNWSLCSDKLQFSTYVHEMASVNYSYNQHVWRPFLFQTKEVEWNSQYNRSYQKLTDYHLHFPRFPSIHPIRNYLHLLHLPPIRNVLPFLISVDNSKYYYTRLSMWINMSVTLIRIARWNYVSIFVYFPSVRRRFHSSSVNLHECCSRG